MRNAQQNFILKSFEMKSLGSSHEPGSFYFKHFNYETLWRTSSHNQWKRSVFLRSLCLYKGLEYKMMEYFATLHSDPKTPYSRLDTPPKKELYKTKKGSFPEHTRRFFNSLGYKVLYETFFEKRSKNFARMMSYTPYLSIDGMHLNCIPIHMV